MSDNLSNTVFFGGENLPRWHSFLKIENILLKSLFFNKNRLKGRFFCNIYVYRLQF
jgi:hypothetical protein